MFSKACEYGIRAIIHIAYQSQKDKRVSLKDVAVAIDSPVAFTAKILQALAKDDLIVSVKGARGGYEIKKDQSIETTLFSVVSSIDGDQIFNKCGIGLKNCNSNKPCPVHFQFKALREELAKMLQSTTIVELAKEYEFGKTYLKT